MSGHSHWSKVKHQKGAADEKRGKVFSKLSRLISIAAREKGADPDANSALRLAIEQAKKENMPKDNIERAMKHGTGELAGEKLEGVSFEALGPGGIAIIIEGITDNTNRTLGEIKQILNQNKGKLAGEGSVRWLFVRKGVLVVEGNKEQVELAAIEAGGEDMERKENMLFVYTKPEQLEAVRKSLENAGVSIASASLDWVAKEEIALEEKEGAAVEKLFEALDDNDAVQDIYSNLT